MSNEIIEDPSLGVQALRWENAKELAFAFKSYCMKNNLGFILEDGITILEQHAIVVSEFEINIVKDNCSFNLFLYDVNYDHGIHDTTEEWFKNCSLYSAKMVALVDSEKSFKNLITVESDSINVGDIY